MLNQEKIGKFIAERRKVQNLTQKQLADKLGVSDKAVSKWETGRSMPDNAILFELCDSLGINVNELLSGEKLSDDSYHGKAEENIMTLMKEKQNNGRLHVIVGIILGVLFVLLCTQSIAGNLIWFFDVPSLVMIVVFILFLLFMAGLVKAFFKGIAFFFGKAGNLDKVAFERMIAAYKLVLIALPTGGVIMTLLAVVSIMADLAAEVITVTQVGSYIAVALITLLYCLVFEVLLLPIAAKLWSMKKIQ